MSQVSKHVKTINEKAKKGEHIALYLDDFLPKFSKVFPSIVKGELTLVTGSTGSGKTQFSKALGMNYPLQYAKRNNIDLKIIYICLEETKLEFKQKMTVRFVHQEWDKHFNYPCDISYSHLNGTRKRKNPDGGDGYFSEKELKLIDICSDKTDKVMENVYLITDVGSPTKLFRDCQKLAQSWGNYEIKEQVVEYEDPLTGKKVKLKDRLLDYKPSTPNEHVIVIMDHMSLIMQARDPLTGKTMSERETIAKWNTYYSRAILCKKFDWSVINVIQQNLDTDKLRTSIHGEKMIEQAKPSLGNIGNARESARDAHNVIGVFNPRKFNIDKYMNYSISKMGDTFRSLILLKNRNGNANVEKPMIFDGISQTFIELPPHDNPLMDSKFYPMAQKIIKRFIK